MGGAASAQPNNQKCAPANRHSVRRMRVFEESVDSRRKYISEQSVDSNLSVSIRPGGSLSRPVNGGTLEVLPEAEAHSLVMEPATRNLLMIATEKLLVIDGSDIHNDLIDMVLGLMKLNIFNKAGITIIREGEIGSHVFVVESGKLQVTQRDEPLRTLERGDLFGERALLHDCCRSSTVTTIEPCRLWRLDRASFKLIQKNAAKLTENLRVKRFCAVPDLAALSRERMTQLMAHLTVTSFQDGEELYKEGKCTSKVMLIEEGFVELMIPETVTVLTEAEMLKVAGITDPSRLKDDPLMKSQSSGEEGQPCPSLDAMNAMSSIHELTKFESAGGSGLRRLSDSMRKKFGPGSILGIGVLHSKSGTGWRWMDEMCNGVPLVGAVPPVTIVALSQVRVAYFTTHQFEKLFGPTSAFYFFSTKEMTDFLDRSRRQSEANEAARKQSEMAEIKESQEADNIDDKIAYTMEYFDKVTVISQISLGSIAIAHKKEVAASDDSAKTALSEPDDHHETRHSNHDADDAVTTTATESSLHEHHDAAAIAPDDSAPVLTEGRFVLKIISKAIASRQKQEVHVMAEAQALKALKHPFLCRLYGKFQTPKDLVLVLERVSGGDLWCVMYEATDVPRVSRMGGSYLSLDLVRFYIASLILALEFMHQRGTAFRNLKPENVLIDERGYVRLVGFGFAKKYPFTDDSGVQQHRSFTFCGTLEYLSPEIVVAIGHDVSADTWALGILLYELLAGETPFAHVGEEIDEEGKRRKTADGDSDILAAIANCTRGSIPYPRPLTDREKGLGIEALLNGLLQPTASERYPMTTVKRSPIQRNNVFKGFSWSSLLNKNMPPPYVPSPSSCTYPRKTSAYVAPHEAFSGNQTLFSDF